MPYIKNKQQSFQAAEQAFVQAEQAVSRLEPNDEDFGHHLKRAKQEVIEAELVINKALINASEHQRHQLEKYSGELEQLKGTVEEF